MNDLSKLARASFQLGQLAHDHVLGGESYVQPQIPTTKPEPNLANDQITILVKELRELIQQLKKPN
jgi:hypothetical protein